MIVSSEQRDFLEHLFINTYAMLLAYATSALQDNSLAEESVQNTFRIACIKIDALMSSPNPSGWLMNTLKFTIKNKRREIARRSNEMSIEQIKSTIGNPVSDLSENELAVMEWHDDYTDIHYGDLVSKEDFELVCLILFEKYTIGEAAAIKGISYEACKTRYRRAKKNLQSALEKADIETIGSH